MQETTETRSKLLSHLRLLDSLNQLFSELDKLTKERVSSLRSQLNSLFPAFSRFVFFFFLHSLLLELLLLHRSHALLFIQHLFR